MNRLGWEKINRSETDHLGGKTWKIDVGFPSVCYEYVLFPLVNKDIALAYGKAEYNKAGNPSRDRGGKKAKSEITHVASEGERCHNLTGKLRLLW